MEVENEMDADDDDDDEVNEKEREEDVTLEVIDEEIQDFEDKEASLMSIFKREGLKRLSCFAHTLQLVVATLNSDPSTKDLLDTVYRIVKKVNRSGKAVEDLVAWSGKKLVSHSPTRWTTAYLVVHRLVEVKEHLQQVAVKHNIEMLQPEHWEALEQVDKLLSLFAVFTDTSGGEKYATISQVIPYIMELHYHLKQMSNSEAMSNAAELLDAQLTHRFQFVTDPKAFNHSPIYVVATMLDPGYKIMLDSVQIEYGRAKCLEMIKSARRQVEQDPLSNNSDKADSPSATSDIEASQQITSPPSKRAKSRYSLMLLQEMAQEKAKDREMSQKKGYLKTAQSQLDTYLQSSIDDYPDPFEYWESRCPTLTVLAPFAMDVLSIPASSTSVERVFSTAGHCSSGRKNRLSGRRLEREVLIKKNIAFLENFL